jgi:hypothetical protein
MEENDGDWKRNVEPLLEKIERVDKDRRVNEKTIAIILHRELIQLDEICIL